MASPAITTNMGKADWEAVENELRSPHCYGVDMLVDGHRLKLQVVEVKKFRYAIAVYIDGWIKGECMKVDSEIGAKFWHPFSVRLFSAHSFKEMERASGKRFANMMRNKYQPVVAGYEPYWNSVRAFRRHITRTCTDIRLLGVGWSGRTKEEASAPEVANG